MDFWYAPAYEERHQAVVYVFPEYKHVLAQGVYLSLTEIEEPRLAQKDPEPEKPEKPKPNRLIIYFDFNKDKPKRFDPKGLDKDRPYLLVGHADWIGSEGYNLRLSQRRAFNVKKLLEKEGLKDLKVEWRGEKDCEHKKGHKITPKLIRELEVCRKVEVLER